MEMTLIWIIILFILGSALTVFSSRNRLFTDIANMSFFGLGFIVIVVSIIMFIALICQGWVK
jgi:hypothetical protein